MSPFLAFSSGWLCRAGTRGSTERRHHGDGGDRQGRVIYLTVYKMDEK